MGIGLGLTRFRIVVLLLALGVKAGVAQRQPPAPAWRGQCPPTRDGRLFLTQDSVGYLPIRGSFEAIRRLCPGATDTIVVAEDEGGDAVPALTMHFGALQVIVTQNAETLYARGSPDLWIVRGSPVFVPTGAELTVSYAKLRAEHRVLSVSTFGASYQIDLCDLPNLALYIRRAEPAPYRWPVQVDSVPADAVVDEIWILTGANAVMAREIRDKCEAMPRRGAT
jgi:hypothetical protein